MKHFAKSTRRTHTVVDKQDDSDFVQTPLIAVQKLLGVESFTGPIWEPACGAGAIAKPLRAAGHIVQATDKYEYEAFQADVTGVDFLEEDDGLSAMNIVTNPPFRFLDAFMQLGLARCTRKLALFTRWNALTTSNKRNEWYLKNPPTRVWAFRKRIPYVDKHNVECPSMATFCWQVWDKAQYRGVHAPTSIGWV